ncbi:MAG: SMC family ATPase [Candidatus Hadarchaeales archaeon]
MRILGIRLHNFLSHVETAVTFPRDGVYKIEGPNGSGKSSLIVDSILFGLYGRTRGGTKLEDLMHRPPFSREDEGNNGGSGPKETKVEVVFALDGIIYRVTRGFRGSSSGKTKAPFARLEKRERPKEPFVVVAQGVTEVSQAVQDLLKLSYPLFASSVALEQGSRGRFCHASPAERANLLSELLELQRYQEAEERCKTRIRELESRKSYLQGRLEGKEEVGEGLLLILKERIRKASLARKAAKTEIMGLLLKRRGLREEIKGLEEQLRHLKERASRERSLEEEKERLEGIVHNLESRLSALRKTNGGRIPLSPEALLEVEEKLREEIKKREEETKGLTELLEVERHLREVEKRIEETLEKEGICPYCGQELPPKVKERAITREKKELSRLLCLKDEVLKRVGKGLPTVFREDDLLEEIRAREKRRAAIEEEADRNKRAYREAVSHQREIDKLVGQLESERSRLGVIGEELRTLREEREKGREEQRRQETEKRVEELQEEAESLDALLRKREGDNARASSQLETAKDEYRKAKKEVEEIAEYRDELESIQKKLKALELARRAFSREGIPRLVIERAIMELEERANDYLSMIPTNASPINLKLKYVPHGRGDKLEIFSFAGEREAPYETFSGGERNWIDLAVHLSLAELASARRGVRLESLIVDEAVENLDTWGKESFISILQMLQQKRFPRVFFLSHSGEFSGQFESCIQLTKTEGVSRVLT